MAYYRCMGNGGSGIASPVKIQYLAYGHCGIDDGTYGVNKPLTVCHYTEYSTHLTYDNVNNQFEVLQDFEAVLVPWVKCYNLAGGVPQMAVMLNGNYLIKGVITQNVVDSISGIADSVTEYAKAAQVGGDQKMFPNVLPGLNGLRIKLNQGDTIALQKAQDTGYSDFNIKIYKLCESTTTIDNFLDSIFTLSDTNTYREIDLQTSGSATLVNKTITSNGVYQAFSDNADGYDTVTVNVTGGYSSLERLCYAEYVGRDSIEIPTISTLVRDVNFDNYLSYSTSTKKFTALASFDAFIVPWVYSYGTASGSESMGAFYINNNKMVDFHCSGRSTGSKAGQPFFAHINVGDELWNYTPDTDGYPQQMLKIYKVIDMPMNALATAQTLTNENP